MDVGTRSRVHLLHELERYFQRQGDVYPHAWEAMMGDIWFNGEKLLGSRFGAQDVGTSALINTVSYL